MNSQQIVMSSSGNITITLPDASYIQGIISIRVGYKRVLEFDKDELEAYNVVLQDYLSL